MKTSPYQQYKQTQFETANKEKLILMLYDGGIKFLKQAEKCLLENNLEDANYLLTRAQDIISELMVNLNMETGEIADNLYKLYDYMRRQLIKANMQKKQAPIIEVRDMLSELRDVWEEASLKIQKDNLTSRQVKGDLSLEEERE